MTIGQARSTIVEVWQPAIGQFVQYVGCQLRTGIGTMINNTLDTTSASTNAARGFVVLIRRVAIASVVYDQTSCKRKRFRFCVL